MPQGYQARKPEGCEPRWPEARYPGRFTLNAPMSGA
jgi:hypothetical protein